MRKQKVLDRCTNMHGKLGSELVDRIKDYLNEPTMDRWDDIHSIIIDGRSFKTIWNAVLEYDPTFPSSGRVTDANGRIIQEWARIPTPFELMKAIQLATRPIIYTSEAR